MTSDASELHTRPSLLLRIRDHQDAEAWQTFVDVYAPLIYGYCRHRRLQESDAADVAQEVLTRVARSMRNFEYSPDRGRFRDWLGTIARNEIVRFQTRAKRPGEGAGGEAAGVLDSVASADQDSAWSAQFHAHLLETALGRVRPHFDPATWRAFELVWLDDAPAPQVARQLGLAVEKVYVAKSRVLKRLREEVLLLGEDSPLLARGGE
jgi:RNA polymerase sigma-70 factor (ECF subfamily)